MRFFKRVVSLLMLLAVLSAPCAHADLQRLPILDSALSMLEEGNIFLSRYNAITGAAVEPVFKYGLPYFFGGMHTYENQHHEPLLFSRYPEYAIGLCKQQSMHYDIGQYYIYGLDCAGFTHWIFDEVGLPQHPSLDDMLTDDEYAVHHLYSSEMSKKTPAFSELAKHLQPGDLLVVRRGMRHVMMFIGTLRDFGFTEADLPQLAAYLDYPLVVHCGSNFDYSRRIAKYLEEKAGDSYYRKVLLPDGGVAVSIVGVPKEEAPYHGHYDVTDYAWYVMPDGYPLTVYSVGDDISYCWYRSPAE